MDTHTLIELQVSGSLPSRDGQDLGGTDEPHRHGGRRQRDHRLVSLARTHRCQVDGFWWGWEGWDWPKTNPPESSSPCVGDMKWQNEVLNHGMMIMMQTGANFQVPSPCWLEPVGVDGFWNVLNASKMTVEKDEPQGHIRIGSICYGFCFASTSNIPGRLHKHCMPRNWVYGRGRDEMVHYSFQELEDGLNLPADAIETSPKIIGNVMMLGIAKAIMGDWSCWLPWQSTGIGVRSREPSGSNDQFLGGMVFDTHWMVQQM